MATIVIWIRAHQPLVVIDNDLIRYLFARDAVEDPRGQPPEPVEVSDAIRPERVDHALLSGLERRWKSPAPWAANPFTVALDEIAHLRDRVGKLEEAVAFFLEHLISVEEMKWTRD